MENQTYEITTNLPIPTARRKGNRAVETLKLCKAGDSFVLTSLSEKIRMYNWAKRNGISITARAIVPKKSWRVWRLS